MGFLLLGLDSLVACIAISPLVNKWSYRILLAVLFGLADGVGFILGSALGMFSFLRVSEEVGEGLEVGIPFILGAYLIVIALLAMRTQRVTDGAAAGWIVWILPFVLAIDNFSFGLVGDSSAGSILGQAFGQQAWSSALLALVGLCVGVVLPRVIPAFQRRAVAVASSGVALVVAAGILMMLPE